MGHTISLSFLLKETMDGGTAYGRKSTKRIFTYYLEEVVDYCTNGYFSHSS